MCPKCDEITIYISCLDVFMYYFSHILMFCMPTNFIKLNLLIVICHHDLLTVLAYLGNKLRNLVRSVVPQRERKYQCKQCFKLLACSWIYNFLLEAHFGTLIFVISEMVSAGTRKAASWVLSCSWKGAIPADKQRQHRPNQKGPLGLRLSLPQRHKPLKITP